MFTRFGFRCLVSLAFLWSLVHPGRSTMPCYTCSVDFRSVSFEANNSCLFPHGNEIGKTICSEQSKYCQGTIIRINGIFVMLVRTCETSCGEYCTEKGYGVRIKECKYCCDATTKKSAECGYQGY